MSMFKQMQETADGLFETIEQSKVATLRALTDAENDSRDRFAKAKADVDSEYNQLRAQIVSLIGEPDVDVKAESFEVVKNGTTT